MEMENYLLGPSQLSLRSQDLLQKIPGPSCMWIPCPVYAQRFFLLLATVTAVPYPNFWSVRLSAPKLFSWSTPYPVAGTGANRLPGPEPGRRRATMGTVYVVEVRYGVGCV